MKHNKNLFYRLLAFILCTSAACALFPFRAYAAPDVSARAAVLYQPDCGIFAYEKNADTRLPMASTTKVMTALISLKLADTDTVFTVPAEACGIEGSSVYLKAGDRLTCRELLYALLLRSANDAAAALALCISGSFEAFAEEMNREAARLGLNNTHFANPHGLDSEEHYSSARDLALLLAEAMQNEEFAKISGTPKYTLTFTDRAQVLHNHNKLLYMRDDVLGGKTGFTKKSGRCLVSAAKRDGVQLIAVTLSAPNDWKDHGDLFDYGYSLFEEKQLISENDVFRVPISGSIGEYATCRPAESFSAVVPKNGTHGITCNTLLPSIRFAPVRTGDALGIAEIQINGNTLCSIVLLADKDMPEKNTNKHPSLLRRFFHGLFGK